MNVAIIVLVSINLIISISVLLKEDEQSRSPMEKVVEIMEYSVDGKHLVIKDGDRKIKLSVSDEVYEK
jgi:hypothetical protein